ncbi:peroxisomal membrane protein, partial [Thalassiosira pseudonana CCMP1335]
SNKDVINGLSGAIGSTLSISIFYPVETIRTRLQVDSTLMASATSTSTARNSSTFCLIYKIGKKEGWSSLYKGWHSMVVALMCLNFVYFYCFHLLRRWLTEYDASGEQLEEIIGWIKMQRQNKMIVDLVVGYLAGVFAVLVTGPLWLVNTRSKLQGVNVDGSDKEKSTSGTKYRGMIHCLLVVSKEEGILYLWRGTFTSIILSLNPAIQLGVYEMLKRHHLLIGNARKIIGTLEPFVNALFSKFISTICTYPIQVIQTQNQAGIQTTNNEKKQGQAIVRGWIQELMQNIHRQGIRGLYRGLESKLIQTCLNSALMFVVYERLKSA